MEGLTSCGLGARLPLRIHTNSSKNCPFSRRRPGSFLVLAAQDGPEFDKWEQMELKFGRLLGEDPKLTLAKVMSQSFTSSEEVLKSVSQQLNLMSKKS